MYLAVQCERNMDYMVANRVVAEMILDAEFKDPVDKGYFYIGNYACRILFVCCHVSK